MLAHLKTFVTSKTPPISNNSKVRSPTSSRSAQIVQCPVLGSSHLGSKGISRTIQIVKENTFFLSHLIVDLYPTIFDTALLLWCRWGFRGLGGYDNMFVLADAAVFQRYFSRSSLGPPPCLGPSPCLG